MARSEIIDNANEKEFTLTLGDAKHIAKMVGKKLDYPIVYILGNRVEAEISWSLAEKIAKGETNNVDY